MKIRVLVLRIKLYASWVSSLKEKRMIVRSIQAKIQNKFHVSVSEVENQDVHQTIVIAVAAIIAHQAQADSMEEEILRFVERNTEAEIIESEAEVR